MGVERERVEWPKSSGSAIVTGATRQANGDWSVQVAMKFRVTIDDTRDVYLERTVSVRTAEQRGRRAVVKRGGPITLENHPWRK